MKLTATGVRWKVGRRTILDGIDLSVAEGQLVGLIGPNGSGKSSLLRLLAGLRRPSAGVIELDGRSLQSLPRRAVARRIAFVEQAAVTDQNPLVRDVLDLGRTPHRQAWSMVSDTDRAVIDRVARDTDIESMLLSHYGSLSGGERQRVQIARGFVQEPELLILDEPTNHLDVDAREALIQALNEYSGAVIVVSHDRHMLEMTADRLVLVDRGTAKEFDGSIDDYIAFVLAKDPPAARGDAGKGVNKKDARKAAAEAREKGNELRKAARKAEAELERLTQQRSAIDQAMFDPGAAKGELAKLTMTELMKRRAMLEEQIEGAELAWLAASEALESLAA